MISFMFFTTFILMNIVVGVVVSSVIEVQEEASSGTSMIVSVLRCDHLVRVIRSAESDTVCKAPQTPALHTLRLILTCFTWYGLITRSLPICWVRVIPTWYLPWTIGRQIP